MPKAKTGLANDLEYDPSTKQFFIILAGKKAKLGSGCSKKVTYAFQYRSTKPKLVARLEQTRDMRRELSITKKMKDTPGIYKTLAFTKHRKDHKKFKTIYSKLYRSGTLQDVLEKKISLTSQEKRSIALQIIQGLEALHTQGIAHRDLSARNYLVDIAKRNGKRTIEACIADLGHADFVKTGYVDKMQGGTKYTPPEALFKVKFKKEAFKRADIFALGSVFYWLFYNKRPAWLVKKYVTETNKSVKSRYKRMCHCINKATKKRRNHLLKKAQRTSKEAFELAILRMLSVNPEKRPSATKLRQQLENPF